jgi:hypothetical protein
VLQVQLRAEQPVTLSGSMDDSDVRRVLTYVVKNSDRFDAGVRLDCLDALKTRIHDDEIRGALLEAARRDHNPAIRMKALEALRDVAGDEEVRDVLLEALNNDANPGVRVEAVNLLVRSLEIESMPPTSGVVRGPESDMPMISPVAPVALSNDDPSQRSGPGAGNVATSRSQPLCAAAQRSGASPDWSAGRTVTG